MRDVLFLQNFVSRTVDSCLILVHWKEREGISLGFLDMEQLTGTEVEDSCLKTVGRNGAKDTAGFSPDCFNCKGQYPQDIQ